MFRLAHISDIHLGPLPALSLRELASKRITGYVNWHRNRRKRLFGGALELLLEEIEQLAPDHVAVTGDLINLATNAEIAAATAWLQAAGAPDELSLVPGNHDAYVPGAYEKICKAWRPWMTGDDRPVSHSGDTLFPYLRIRGPVALIGVSTANATPPFMASGYFGRGQARRLVDHLRDAGERGLFRIVMIHHPPIRGATSWHKRMVGIRRFAAAMRTGGGELVIHGHTHLNTVHWLTTRHDRRLPVVGIASASQGHSSGKPSAALNLFEVEGRAGAWRCTRRLHRLDGSTTTIVAGPAETLMG